jgi:hypothetical protein
MGARKMTQSIPAPPPGFILQDQPNAIPAPPSGFQLVEPKAASPDDQKILNVIRRSMGLPEVPIQEDQPSTAVDVAKSGASGVARGTADLLGLPGTLADAMNSGGQWVLRKGYEAVTGGTPEPGTFFGGPKPELSQSNPLSGAKIEQALSAVTGGATDYQPKTVPGEYARTVGEFAPNAIGPGGWLRKAAQVIIPALSSETAGQATKGTALEPYARILAALGGAGAANIGSATSVTAPTAKEIFREGGDAFEAAKPTLKAAQISNDTYGSIVNALRAKADDFGLVPEAHGPVDSFLKRHEAAAAPAPSGIPGVVEGGAEPSLYDLEIARRGLGHIGKSNVTNPSLGSLAGKLTGELDNAVDNLGASSLKAGDPTEADAALKTLADARQTWRTGIKSQMVENAIEQAQNAASGVENGLRVEFRKLLKDKNAKNFDDTELAAIKQVARGTFTQNALRWLGGFGVPTDSGRNFLGSVAGALSGNAIGGPVGAVVLPAAGTAAKIGASTIAERNAAIASALVKSGKPGSDLYRSALASSTEARRLAIARALMQSSVAAKAGLPQQQ